MQTKTMHTHNDELYIGDFSINDLACLYQTPLYIYDEAHIRQKLDIFKYYFTSKHYACDIVYASKAFVAPHLVRLIHEYGFKIDSLSMSDLHLLQRTNFPHSHIVMHGNNKHDDELNYALDEGIGLVVVDNLEELTRLEAMAKTKNKTISILLRVNPGIHAHTHAYIKTSLLSSKFGESIFDNVRIEQLMHICLASAHLKLEGFHAHIGSNINQPKPFISEVKVMMEFMKMIKDTYHFQTNILDLGGGFGIKYLPTDQDINLPQILALIIDAVDKSLKKYQLSIQRLMIEPGRSIVGDAGLTVYTVGATKDTYGGKKYVFVDGGMADNIRPALYQAKYTIDHVTNPNQERLTRYDIVGKFCESGDIVANDILLGEVKRGDRLVVYATGAYGYSMSSNYNGATRPSVLFIHQDRIVEAIRRESVNNVLHTAQFKEQKVFDIHTDVLYDLYMQANQPHRFNQVHVQQLKQSVIKGGVWTMYSPDDFNLIDACKIAIDAIDLSQLPGFEVILGLEGLRNLTSIADIDTLYHMGFRHAMLTWNEENQYATGAKGNPNHGLHQQGRELIQRMASLDMIIDLAHLNQKSFFDVLEVTQKNIIYSHGNVKALCDHVRNVTDEQMDALKRVGGLLGLTLAGSFVSSDPSKRNIAMFVEHIRYAVDRMGVDLVCFGFDFMDYLDDFANSNLADLSSAPHTYRLINAMREAGFSEVDIEKICYKNFYRRFADKVVLKG